MVDACGGRQPVALLVASFPDSILAFRGALISALRGAGFDVHVAAPGVEPGSEHHARLVAHGLTAHAIALARTGRNPLADLRSFVELWGLMRRLRPALVLCYTIKPVVYGAIASWLARIPRRFALVTGLGYAFQAGTGRAATRRIARALYALALRRVSKVFFQNEDDLALFRSSGLLRPTTPAVVVSGSGVDLAEFPARPLPSGPPSFLMIGRLLGDKGVREYADAARQVRQVHPAARFALAGWIDDNPDAIRRAELDDWVARGDVVFLGRLEDVRPALAACTVYVLPSYREGLPRTVLEAMATGRAVITTDAPGCRETVVDGHNGFLVPPRSADAVARAALLFYEQPALAATMGRHGRERAVEHYDARRVSAVMLSEMGVIAQPPPQESVHA